MISKFAHIILPSIWDELELSFIGDMHVGAKACHEERLINDLERCNRNDTNYTIFLGDNIDAVIPKDAKRFSPSGAASWLWDNSLADGKEFPLEAVIDRQEKRLLEILRHRRPNRVLGIADGNHEAAYLKYHAHDVTRTICASTGYEMLGYAFFLTVTVGFEDDPRTYKITIYGHHGYGGGSRTEGYNLTKFSKHMPYFDADIYAFAHVHDQQNKIIPRLAPVPEEKRLVDGDKKHANEGLQFRDQILVVTGTYLRTLSEGRFPSYSEEKGYPPRKLGFSSALVSVNPHTDDLNMGHMVK